MADMPDVSRRAFLSGLVGALGLGLVACGSNAMRPANFADQPERVDGRITDDESVLLVGSEIAFPPYEWLTEKESEFTAPVKGGGYVDGLDVALAKLIAAELGKGLLFVNMTFSALIDALNLGKVDIVLSGMGDSPERAKVVAFSKSYYDSVFGLLVRRDGTFANAKEISDFKGASILGQKNSPLDDMIEQIPEARHLDPVDHVPEMIDALVARTCDAVTIPVETVNVYLAPHPELALVVPQNPRLDPGFTGTCAALRKDDTAMLEVVNGVIESLSKEELQRLYEEAEKRQANEA